MAAASIADRLGISVHAVASPAASWPAVPGFRLRGPYHLRGDAITAFGRPTNRVRAVFIQGGEFKAFQHCVGTYLDDSPVLRDLRRDLGLLS